MNIKKSDLPFYNFLQKVIGTDSDLLKADIAFNTIEYAKEYNLELLDAICLIQGVWSSIPMCNNDILRKYVESIKARGHNMTPNKNHQFSQKQFESAGKVVEEICQELIDEFRQEVS